MPGVPATFSGLCRAKTCGLALHLIVESANKHTLATIVGAGPVGLLLGCLLQRYGVNCQIIEQEENRSNLTKALMIHSASLDILQHIKVVDDVIQQGIIQKSINFDVDGQKRYTLDFTKLTNSSYPYFLNIRQPLLEEILERKYIESGGILLRGYKFISAINTSNSVTLSLSYKNNIIEWVAPWLVGCDGANSSVRKSINMPFSGIDYPYSYVLAEGIPNKPVSNNSSYMLINSSSALSILPMDNGEVRIAGPALCEDLSDKEINQETAEEIFVNTNLQNIPEIIKYSAIRQYKVRERLADKFSKGRIILCGDAAHIHSPTGGQAMNLGFGDAFSLAWRLALHNNLDKSIIQYGDERRYIAKAVIENTKITNLLSKLRNSDVSKSYLEDMTKSFSQLYHHICAKHEPLCSSSLSIGSRVPNLLLDINCSLWSKIESGWVDLNSKSVTSQALFDIYKKNVVIKIRPDFIIEKIQAKD